MAIDGKEKALVAAVLGALTAALTSGASFVAPDSTVGHVVTAAIVVVGFVATWLGVILVPNSKVGEAVKATGVAVLSVQDSLTPPPVLDDAVADAPPVLSDAEVASALGGPEAQ